MLTVGLLQKEEIVEFTLLAPCCAALVCAQLVVAQAFESFTLPARLLKNPLLLIPQILPPREFMLGVHSQPAKRRSLKEHEAQFRRGGAVSQFARLDNLRIPNLLVDLIEKMSNSGNLLVGRAQAKFLLVFDALPKMKHGL